MNYPISLLQRHQHTNEPLHVVLSAVLFSAPITLLFSDVYEQDHWESNNNNITIIILIHFQTSLYDYVVGKYRSSLVEQTLEPTHTHLEY